MKQELFEIKHMQISEIPQLIILGKKVGLGMSSDERETLEMKQLVQRNATSCLVAESAGQVIGMIFGAFNGRRAWTYHLAVDPEWQHQGIWSQLLQKSQSALEKIGCTKILLGVHVLNLKTVPFYEKNGFMVMNDAVLLEKDIFKRGGE